MPFAATWMDLEIIILSEVSQSEKDKYMILLILWNLFLKLVQMILFTKQSQTQTDIENKLTATKRKGGAGIN